MVTKLEEYLTCIKIWNKFDMKNIGYYHDHYLEKDVLLLFDVFEKFIDTSLKFYKLEFSTYFSFSGLSWDAMLKVTKINLEHWQVFVYLKRIKEEEVLIFVRDIMKAITKTQKFMVLQNHQST